MAPDASNATRTPFLPEGLLLDLLAVSLTGVNVLRPVYGPAHDLVDFAIEYLNPIGQRMTGLTERPGGTLLTHFPHAIAADILGYYQRVYEAGDTGLHEVNYQADGLDNYFRLAARRSGEWLVVSFTDTSSQNRSAVELALRESQAREQAARLEAEHQRNELWGYVAQAPVAVAVYRGAQHHVVAANAATLAIWGRAWADVRHRPVFEVLPEAAAPEVVAFFDQVFTTGTPHTARELPTPIIRNGQQEVVYWNFVFEPERQSDGRISGIVSIGTDVTEQVRARQQVQQLNQELEARVQERTRQLRHQQGLLAGILRQVPAAIATLSGPDHRYTFFNDAYQALSEGRTHLGLSVAEVFPEVVAQGFIGLLDQVYATGEPFMGKETPTQLFDAATGRAELRYVDFIYQPLTDEQHQTQGILAFSVEVTDKVVARQQAETLQAQLLATAQHQAAERLAYYEVFEQTPALVALLRTPSHRFEYVNPAYQALFPGRQLVGLDMAVAAPETREQGFVALLDQVYQTGETFFGADLPFAIMAPDGQSTHTTYFNFTYQAYRENGQVAGVSIFAFDVSEQVRARQEGEAQRLRLQRLFLQAPAAICILNGPDLVYELVNPGYQALFPGRELLGKPILVALPEIANNPVYTTFRQVYDTGQTHEEQALFIPLVRPIDGVLEERYFRYVQQARYAADGRIDGVLVFAFEVTEQVQIRQQVQHLNEELAAINEELTATNEELNESNAQLMRTNVDLDTFVYTASHDLKAPITNIESIVLALRDTLPAAVQQDELVAHLLGLLNQTVARFQVTIGQLTDISRLQLAHTGPAEPVILATVVEAVRLDLAPAIAAAGTQLTVEVAPELVVSFSPANLRSIVYNLLSNAIKYRAADRSSQVRVQAEQTPLAIQLKVQDNSLGMSEVQQRQLFGLFQRLHTHVEGTGVGLYITKRLVENAGGTITVDSQPNVGTTFTVTLPV